MCIILTVNDNLTHFNVFGHTFHISIQKIKNKWAKINIDIKVADNTMGTIYYYFRGKFNLYFNLFIL